MRKALAVGAGALISAAAVATFARADNSSPGQFHTVTAVEGQSWDTIAASHGWPVLPGSGTDSTLNTRGDYWQRANRVGVSTSDGSVLPQWSEVLVPSFQPPTSSTTPTSTTTTSTAPPATTTSIAATTTTVPPATTTSTSPATSSSTSSTTSPPTTTQPPTGSSGFSATFDTAADFYDRFQLDVHLRDALPPNNGNSVDWGRVFPGDHDMGCGGPTTQRNVHLQRHIDGAPDGTADLRLSELFWWCAPAGAETGHVMTGMADVDGYTILSFAPDRSFTAVRRVCWDQNLTDLGGRKWTQAVVIPEAAYQANARRLDYISPVTQDVDGTALPLPAGSFMFQLWDHAFRVYNPVQVLEEGFGWSVADKAKRYQHCIVDNENGTVTISQQRELGAPQTNSLGQHVVTVPGDLPDGASRVIFQDDNYTPEKDGPLAGFTWHWDRITVEVAP